MKWKRGIGEVREKYMEMHENKRAGILQSLSIAKTVRENETIDHMRVHEEVSLYGLDT